MRNKGMINPNGDEFMEDDPLAASMQTRNEPENFREAAGDTWERTRQKVGTARERTEFFLRENPVPTILGALVVGLAIGLAIRYSSRPEEKELEIKSPVGNLSLSTLSLPFLWPFFKTVKRKYEDSAEAVKEGVDRIKDIDVDRYVKPLRKRWKVLDELTAAVSAAKIYCGLAPVAGVGVVPEGVAETLGARSIPLKEPAETGFCSN